MCARAWLNLGQEVQNIVLRSVRSNATHNTTSTVNKGISSIRKKYVEQREVIQAPQTRAFSTFDNLPTTPPPLNLCNKYSSASEKEIEECLLRIKRFNMSKIPRGGSQAAFIHGAMEHRELICVLQNKLQRDSVGYKYFRAVYNHLTAHQPSDDTLWTNDPVKNSLGKLAKQMSKQLSAFGEYPITEASKKINLGVFSDFSEYYTKHIPQYKKTIEQYASVREEDNVQQANIIMESFLGYSFEEKIALYLNLILLKEEGAPVSIELLAILDLNIRNEQALNVVEDNKKYMKKLEKMKADLNRLSELPSLPSYKLRPRMVNMIANLSNLSRRESRERSDSTLFEYIPHAQRLLLPKYVHFNVKGVCYFLCLAYTYLIDMYGVEEGKSKLLEIMNDISKIPHYNNSHALEQLRAITSFNIDSHVEDNDDTLISKEELASEEQARYNQEGRLTSKEIADILFDVNSCGGKEHLHIVERSELGVHGCIVFREFMENPTTKEKEVTLHYFEPNIGFITTNNKKLFMHSLMRMEKHNVGCSIHSIQPRAVAGYVNRFGNHTIDFLENRVTNNPLMYAEAPQNAEQSMQMAIDAIVYNTAHNVNKDILPSILSLCRTWEKLNQVSVEHSSRPSSIHLYTSSQAITPQILYNIYRDLDLRIKDISDSQVIPESLLDIDLDIESEERSTLYNFMKELIDKLRLVLEREDLSSTSSVNTELLKAKRAVLLSIENIEKIMESTLNIQDTFL